MQLITLKRDNMAAIYRNVDAIMKKNETEYGGMPEAEKRMRHSLHYQNFTKEATSMYVR